MAKEKYQIFLSYCRAEGQLCSSSRSWTLSLHQELNRKLNPLHKFVFKDDRDIQPGEKWAPYLKRLVKNCEFFLLVITHDWMDKTLIERLQDKDNWVRQEIFLALASGKTIIPLLMDGVGIPTNLPDELKPAVEDSQAFPFSKNTGKFRFEIDQLCERLTGQSSPQTSYATENERFQKLDRVKETSCLRDAAKQGRHAIAICADIQDSPLIFVQRCVSDMCGTEEKSQAIELSWMDFVENISKSLRRQDLEKKISESCGIDAGQNDQEEKLRHYFSKNNEKLIFHSTIPNSGRAEPQKMKEWLEIWSELLEDAPANNVIALLFFPRALFFTHRPELAKDAHKTERLLIRQGLRKVKQDHVTAFIDDMSRAGRLDQQREKELKKKSKGIFFLNFPTRFQKVVDSLNPIL